MTTRDFDSVRTLLLESSQASLVTRLAQNSRINVATCAALLAARAVLVTVGPGRVAVSPPAGKPTPVRWEGTWSDLSAVVSNTLGQPTAVALTTEVNLYADDHAESAIARCSAFVDAAQSVQLEIAFDSRIVADAAFRFMASRINTAASWLLDQATADVAGMPRLGAEERAVLLEAWRGSGALPRVPVLVLHQIREQALKSPGATAFEHGTRTVTYAELMVMVSRIESAFRARGLSRGNRVALQMPRSPEFAASVLAAWACGAAYVPLDHTLPADRSSYMIETAAAQLLVTPDATTTTTVAPQVMPLSLGAANLPEPPAATVFSTIDPSLDDLAYIIFTSGSTGRPKGVQIQQRALSHYFDAHVHTVGLTSRDVISAATSISFDPSLAELFAPLTLGARAVIIDADTVIDGQALRQLIRRHGITTFAGTPTQMRLLIECGLELSDGLERVITGGEALSVELANRLRGAVPSVWNYYGPTETTLYATAKKVTDDRLPPTIGRAMPGYRVYVLDANLDLAPVGALGELCIGGACLSPGYCGQDELTRERFVTPAVCGERVYRTGDWVRFDSDGDLQFVSRMDFQIKIRGYRVELGEIEACLEENPGVAQAVVLARNDMGSHPTLVAYLQMRTDGVRESGAISALLAQKLPAYMLPSHYVFVDKFPLNSSSKVDRKRLPPPSERSPSVVDEMGDDREKRLASIWENLLGVAVTSPQSDFFALGGDSLHVVRAVVRGERHGFHLSVADYHKARTLRALAMLSRDRSGAEPAAGALASGIDDLPPSPIQQWFLTAGYAAPNRYNVNATYRIPPDTTLEFIRDFFSRVVQAHDAFRMSFYRQAGGWRARLAADVSSDQYLRVETLESASRYEVTQRLRHLATHVPGELSLEQLPLFRVVFVQGQPDSYVYLVVHHLISDAVSMEFLEHDLREALRSRGQPARAIDVGASSLAQWCSANVRALPAMRAQLPYWESVVRRPTTRIPGEQPGEAPSSRRRPIYDRMVTVSVSGDRRARLARLGIEAVGLVALGDVLGRLFDGSHFRITVNSNGRHSPLAGVSSSSLHGYLAVPFPFVVEGKNGLPLTARVADVSRRLREVPDGGDRFVALRYGADAEARATVTADDEWQIFFNNLGPINAAAEPPVVPVYLGVGEQWFDDYCPHHLVAGAWQSGDQITFGFVAAFARETRERLVSAFKECLDALLA